MSLLNDNLAILQARHPGLARRLAAYPDKNNVVVFKAKDGGVAYGLRRKDNVQAVSDPNAPLQRIQTQLDQYSKQLQDYTRPILIIGLYPGNELLYLFDACEQVHTPHCPQPIRVCLDSLACLQGFLMSWDARRVLESNRVHWFWHDEVDQEVAWLRVHPEFPHVATLVSGAPDATLNRIMPGFASLVVERDEETRRMQAGNNAYYDAVSDEALAAVISHQSPPPGSSTDHCSPITVHSLQRRPRLLMPTCSWSTYVQHSVRDTSAAFEDIGWETRILKMEAMLTPYYLVKAINDFKPDVFLFIDHLRYEAEDVYPKNMMFVTWVQDDMPNIQSPKAGESLTEYARLRKRDMVVGYTDELLVKNGYPKERLINLHIPANPKIFRPITLTAEQQKKYGCELAFVTNTSMDTRLIVHEKIWPQISSTGLTTDVLTKIHDDLWVLYREGQTLVDRNGFLKWLARYEDFLEVYASLPGGALELERLNIAFEVRKEKNAATPSSLSADDLFRLFYWRLNDAVYRHVVLEWADELGVDLKLYGLGWEAHPRFGKYAAGPVEHGPELNIVYQAAKHQLHLNVTQGMHQRLWEIICAGGAPLVRIPTDRPEPSVQQRLVINKLLSKTNDGTSVLECLDHALGNTESKEWTSAEREELSDFVFTLACHITQRAQAAATELPISEKTIETRLVEIFETKLQNNPAYAIQDWDQIGFHDKSELAARLNRI